MTRTGSSKLRTCIPLTPFKNSGAAFVRGSVPFGLKGFIELSQPRSFSTVNFATLGGNQTELLWGSPQKRHTHGTCQGDDSTLPDAPTAARRRKGLGPCEAFASLGINLAITPQSLFLKLFVWRMPVMSSIVSRREHISFGSLALRLLFYVQRQSAQQPGPFNHHSETFTVQR